MLSDAIDTVLSSYSSVQDQKLYHLGKNRDKIHHEIRKKESKTRFGSEQCVGKQTHLLEIYKDTSEQYAQLHADLLASMKENDNDMYDQIQQQYSTILVAASIMLGNLVADLVQGKFISWEGCANLNGVDDCNSVTYPAKETFVTTLYSISNSLSLGFLFISIIFALQVLVMVRGFMQKRSKEKTKRLRDALQHSKEILEGLREFSLQEGVPSNKRESYKRGKKEKDYFPALDLPLTHDHHGSTSVIPPDKINQRRNIAKLTLDEVNNVFEISEPKLKKALQESEDCINKLHIEFDAKTKNQLFDGFFYDEVEPIGDVSIFSFYAGSFAMFYSFSTWMWTVWTYGYENSDGAMISQYVLLLLLLVIFMIVVYMRFEMYRDQDMSEMIEHLQEKQDPGMEGSFRERLANLPNLGLQNIRTLSEFVLSRGDSVASLSRHNVLLEGDQDADGHAQLLPRRAGRDTAGPFSMENSANNGPTDGVPVRYTTTSSSTTATATTVPFSSTDMSNAHPTSASYPLRRPILGQPRSYPRTTTTTNNNPPPTPLASHISTPSYPPVSITLVTPAKGTPIPNTPT